jgi:DNA-directed RNA polymerase specialized sigma24 family protein
LLEKEVNKTKENNIRLEVLYKQSHNWLTAVAFNLSKDKDAADELVGQLYLYLAEKCNPALWYLNSFNLMYCHSFIKSRFLNKIKSDKRKVTISDSYDEEEIEYDIDKDEKLEKAYDSMLDELKRLERTRLWAPSKIAQMYFFDSEMTLERLASELHLSKSTAFLNVKKIKKHLRENLNNPFTNEK